MPPFLTIDTFFYLTCSTLLHPFPALLTLLSVVSLGNKTTSDTFKVSALYLAVVTLFYLFQLFDARLGAGISRKIDWEDEVVVITGGAGGLGGLLAETYAMRGVPVAVLDVKHLNRQEMDEWEEKGVSYYRCDVGDRRQVETVAKTIEQDIGAPTILINNAAVVNGKQFLDLTDEDIDRTYRVNLLSHYHIIQTFLPNMLLRANGGTIVTVSSVLGYLGCAGLSDYTSSKAALIALHHSLRAELALLSTNPPRSSTQFPNTLLIPDPKAPAEEPASTSTSTSTIAPKAPPTIHPSEIRLLLLTPGQLSTPLFSRITPPSSFLGPTVTVAELAAATVALVDAGVHGEVAVPLYARWIGVMGVLPPGLRGLARRWAGLDAAGWEGCVLKRRGGAGKEE